jgi:hypothetical protein
MYKAGVGELNSNTFHHMCDGRGMQSVVIIKTTTGHVFGGYLCAAWARSNGWIGASGSNIFTLKNNLGIPPTMFANSNSSYSAMGTTNGFQFGGDIAVDLTTNVNTCNFPQYYSDSTGKGKALFTGDAASGNFTIEEIEVFWCSN